MNWFNNIAESTGKSVGFLFLLSLFFFIGLGHNHLFDWDEINFAESAREMIATGDYLHVYINYEPFWEKPPLFFLMQVGAMKIFGINEFAARFPNAIFGFLYLITFYFIGKKHFSARFGLMWGLVFFASLLPHIYFKSGIIDPVFNFFIFLSIYFMLRVIDGKQEKFFRLAIFSGIFSGLSVVTKGPVGFLLLGLTLFVYMVITRFKNFPSVKKISGFLVGFLAIILIWLGLEVAQNGWDMLWKFILYQVDLFNNPVAGHAQPFYYHFVVILLFCFPMSILALPAFFNRTESPMNFKKWMLCLFWVVLILFSITTTKIIHYSSMCYIPLAFLAATTIDKKLNFKGWMKGLYLFIGGIVSLVFIAFPILMMNRDWLIEKINDPIASASLTSSIPWSGFESLVGILFLVTVIISFICIQREKYTKSILILSAGIPIALLFTVFFTIPKVESMSQGPAIEFYEKMRGKDVYVETNFKSYAHYFYFRPEPNEFSRGEKWHWIAEKELDKPAYLVTLINNTELEDYFEGKWELLEVKGGFKFYQKVDARFKD